MSNKPDKYDEVADVLSDLDYGIDDLAKLFCRVIGRSFWDIGQDRGSIRKVIYGEGQKFILRVNMLPQESYKNTEEE